MNHRLAGAAILGLLFIGAAIARAQTPCAPLPGPSGPTIEKWPSDADSLRTTVAGAASGTTILLHDGVYDMSGGDLSHRLVFATPGLTLRSVSGNREAVTLDGNYVTGELLTIEASDTTIADITLSRAYYHPIHVSGPEVPIDNILIHNVHVIDPGEQAVKVNPVEAGTVNDSTLQCSHLELTAEGRPHIRNNCYTGGLDVHAATGWVVRRNLIEGFWCDDGLSEHGIHMWRAVSGHRGRGEPDPRLRARDRFRTRATAPTATSAGSSATISWRQVIRVSLLHRQASTRASPSGAPTMPRSTTTPWLPPRRRPPRPSSGATSRPPSPSRTTW